MKPFTLLLCYVLLINFIGFLLMGIDKAKARRNKWRIPEKTLFLAAILGGSVGSILGMHIFRHKTKHTTFVIGMPCILLLQLTLIFIILFKKGTIV